MDDDETQRAMNAATTLTPKILRHGDVRCDRVELASNPRRRHAVAAATGIVLLIAVAIVAALGAFFVLLFTLAFGWLPGVPGHVLPWAAGCLGVVGASVSLMSRLARPGDHQSTSV